MLCDVIAPCIVTPGGLLFFGGAPKVGKSDFLISWLVYMAAGILFLEMKPSKPLEDFLSANRDWQTLFALVS